jgi:hypothetical protein
MSFANDTCLERLSMVFLHPRMGIMRRGRLRASVLRALTLRKMPR